MLRLNKFILNLFKLLLLYLFMKSQKQILLESLSERGFSDEILNAFSKVKREKFISKELRDSAYEDTALPTEKGQTISQPYTIAMMLSLLELKKAQRVLEIGSGCGYVLALLSEIIGEKGMVFGIEIIKELVKSSKSILKGYKNIRVYNRDGNLGLEEKASFDRILISAASNKIPKPLIKQLKNNGIIVAPLNSGAGQSLIAFKKTPKGELKIKEEIPGFIFVPLVGKN